jgi:aryl-alcohol dehydrogenase-like predicted oxidoreductase
MARPLTRGFGWPWPVPLAPKIHWLLARFHDLWYVIAAARLQEQHIHPSESFLSEFTKGHRETMVMATKYTNAAAGADPNAAGNHRKSMVHQITPVVEVMRGLDDLVRQGKVLYIGISDAPAWWIAQTNTLAHLRDGRPSSGCRSSTA